VAECALAESLGIARRGLGADVAALLTRLGLPARLDRRLPRDRVLSAMAVDKKNRAARVRFALPRDVGTMYPGEGWTVGVEEGPIAAALAGIGEAGGG